MRKLTAVLLIVVATAAFADKTKSKVKDKHFEEVVTSPEATVGNYRGPSESYGLVIEAAPDGKLRGNYVEMGRVAVLHDFEVIGSELRAHASFDDGSSRLITGSFANRVLNGHSAFGVRMRSVPVEGFGEIDTFFERF